MSTITITYYDDKGNVYARFLRVPSDDSFTYDFPRGATVVRMTIEAHQPETFNRDLQSRYEEGYEDCLQEFEGLIEGIREKYWTTPGS